MKTNVRDSSIDVYHEQVLPDKDKARRIENLVRERGPMTNLMISKATGYPTATVSGRVNALKDEAVGILIELPEKRPCPVSGNRVIWVNHKDNMTGFQTTLLN